MPNLELKNAAPITEISSQFIQGMLDRMAMSYHKYGAVAKAYPDKVDAIGSLRQRLREYAKTGNIEYLIDAANFAMIEFMHPRHPQPVFKTTDDNGSPGRIALKSGVATKQNNNDI